MSARERPILFSGPMVRAILDGQKTQTRRVVAKPEIAPATTLVEWNTANKGFVPWNWSSGGSYAGGSRTGKPFASPYGVGGDRLWVRETFWDHGDFSFAKAKTEERIEYRATPWDRKGDPEEAGGWKPSIHMPRWASRISLELTDVRVERLQAITNADAIAEGCVGGPDVDGYSEANPADPYEEYAVLWDSLNAKRGYGWDVNPFVWVLSFSVVESPTITKAVA